MKRLLAIRVQSLTDVITNSSSELFQLRTDKTVEEVTEALNNITRGFLPPVYFDFADYRKNKDVWDQKVKEIYEEFGDDIGKCWERQEELERTQTKYYIYDTVKDWFFDKENPNDIENAYRNYLCYYPDWDHYGEIPDDLQERFKQFVLKNNYVKEGWENFYSDYGVVNPWHVKDKAFEEFKKTHDEIPLEVLVKWSLYGYQSVEDLDGCILVQSAEDNSIPYETWDTINHMFNGTNYHLG